VFAPDKSPVEFHSEILDILLLRKVYAFYVDWGQSSLRVVNVTWTDLDSLAFVLNLGSFAVPVKHCLGHCPWLVLQYRRQMLQLQILLRLESLQCIAGITVAAGHCPRVHQL
jgi:hypothetical protein